MDPVNELVKWGADFVGINIDLIIIVLIIGLIVGIITSVVGSYLWNKQYPNKIFRDKGDKYNYLVDLGSNIVLICIMLTLIIIVYLLYNALLGE